MTRQLVVVDTETNGLDLERHQPVEVAWWNLDTDERGCFIAVHDVSEVLANADIKALQINRYLDRIAERALDRTTKLGAPSEVECRRRADAFNLLTELTGNTLAGSNPAFDAAMLRKLFDGPDPWHHRMLDLSAYAAGVLGLDELPGLARVCELLDIKPGDHTAEADVTATGLCIRELRRRVANR